jgi:hypothetical protein
MPATAEMNVHALGRATSTPDIGSVATPARPSPGPRIARNVLTHSVAPLGQSASSVACASAGSATSARGDALPTPGGGSGSGIGVADAEGSGATDSLGSWPASRLSPPLWGLRQPPSCRARPLEADPVAATRPTGTLDRLSPRGREASIEDLEELAQAA